MLFWFLFVMSYITALATATPRYRHAQTAIAAFMTEAMELPPTEARKLRALFRASGIAYRSSVIADYGPGDSRGFYPASKNLEPFPTTSQRMQHYAQQAPALSEQAVLKLWRQRPEVLPTDITHLVVVSCTGLYAPGLDIDLVQRLGLRPQVQRVCINFMGCYAAFNAIKLAHSFCSHEARVLVVCTELCSLHFQKEHTDDNLLANALFADGAAALLVETKPRPGLNLQPLSFYCDLAPEGREDMAWRVGNFGFEMKLSAYVPQVIQSGIGKLARGLLGQIGDHRQEVHHYAIHPGGKKILDVIEKELGLARGQNAAAAHVLREYGNMSSPTVLFVLERLLATLPDSSHEKNILSFAFGPGLTLESMLLKIVHIK